MINKRCVRSAGGKSHATAVFCLFFGRIKSIQRCAERKHCKPCKLKVLESERNADERYAEDESGEKVYYRKLKAAENEPDNVSYRVLGKIGFNIRSEGSQNEPSEFKALESERNADYCYAPNESEQKIRESRGETSEKEPYNIS